MPNRFAKIDPAEKDASLASLDNLLLYASTEFARFGLSVPAQLCLLARISIVEPPGMDCAVQDPASAPS